MPARGSGESRHLPRFLLSWLLGLGGAAVGLVVSSLVFDGFTHSTDGSCYGIAPLLRNLGPFRPRVTTHVPGLYLAGGSTEHMFGINATIWGGMGTAGAVLGRDLVEEVRAGAVFVDEARLTPVTDDFDALLASKPGSVIRRPARRRPRASVPR